jgi:hypothetical protein
LKSIMRMETTMNRTILIVGAVLAGIGLFIGGIFFSRVNAQTFQPGWMMGNWNDQASPEMMGHWDGQYASGMMTGPGMMGSSQSYPGMMANGQFGGGMMGRMMSGGMMDGHPNASGMMGNFAGSTNVDPLSIEEAETAVADYLASLDNDDLSLGEIMIFDNHAYAQIVDESSETGAFEVLVDPVTGNVFAEPGPNMMWNTEYGMMGGYGGGMMGNMMNGQPGAGMVGGNMMGDFGFAPGTEIDVTAEEAPAVAQEYLDAYLPGRTADNHADAFPGYYTLHVLEDGEVVGMLSVNAYTGQIFLHHWHGSFVEMTDLDHE